MRVGRRPAGLLNKFTLAPAGLVSTNCFRGQMNNKTIRVVLIALSWAALLSAQTGAPQSPAAQAPARVTQPSGSGTIRGSVKDDTGGIIPGAVVTLANPSGTVQTVNSGGDGGYVFRGVPPGSYTVSATYAGLQQEGIIAVSVAAGQPATGNIVMTVQTQRQEVTVTDTSTNTVSTEPSNNATALVLKQEDLDALPDDPDDMEADLQALAGPAAGPGGNQIFIDGFSGGRLPPKESIREIRINSNPFSAEFDKLGYGRIQIFTKPGSDKFHGQGYYNISDDIWNARNPFVLGSPPFRTQLFGGNVSGPIGKHASFFIDAERRNIDDNGVLTASIPTSNFLGTTRDQTYYPTPQRRTTVSPRVDYQLGANNTLSFRYSFLQNEHVVTGIGTYYLPATTIGNINFPSTGYSSNSTEHTIQMVETAVLNAKVVNETHFQYDHEYSTTASQSTAPMLEVQGSFISGGSGYSSPATPHSYDLQNYYELQNYTSVTWGAHTTKFGIRVRSTVLDDSTPSGFNGQYQFNGGAFPVLDPTGLPIGGTSQELTSIQQYLTTVQLLNRGFSSQQVTAMGYGPSKFSVNSGNPYIGLSQTDFGPFFQDDWRVTQNFTLSLGARVEAQTNIHDHSDVAPRFGFAWAPGAKKGGTGRSKTVIRGGWGMFYDRFALAAVENALRNNGVNQITYTQDKPDVYNAAFSITPPLSELATATVNTGQIYEIDSHLQAPRLMQTAIGVERQLFGRTTLSVNFMNSRGEHELRTVDINAPYPIPGTLPPGTPAAIAGASAVSGPRPFGNIGDIYDYQSDGTFKQTQLLFNVNSSVGRWLTLFTRYSYGTAHSDTDGLGTFASDPYNFAADWGRSSLDIHQNLFLGGSVMAPYGVRFSPFIIIHGGTPYNFTTGNDLFLQGQRGTVVRPSIATGPGQYIVDTPYGFLNEYPTVPAPGTSDFVERNIGTGPAFVGINLRVSKTWGFGPTKFAGPSGGSRGGGGGGGGHDHGGGGGGFGGGGPRGMGGESSEHRYNVTVSVNARNILNHTNLNSPVGVITSPFFQQSNGITGGFTAENTSSENRRIDLQLRFQF